jgi:hypothetical protein
MYQTLCKLPQICVKISMQGWWADGEGQQEKRPIHLPNPGMDFYSANSLKQQSTSRHVAPLRHYPDSEPNSLCSFSLMMCA